MNHLKQAVSALQRNDLANETDLFIASDFQKTDADAEAVEALREYVSGITGFRSVNKIFRECNYGPVRNYTEAMDFVFESSDRLILMEDDVLCAPGFLAYMNSALEFYEDDPRIGSISAFCPPFGIPGTYKPDVFALVRMNPWGVGLWRDYRRLERPISEEAYSAVYGDRKRRRALELNVGQEALLMIRQEFEGKVDAGDMKMIFWQFVEDKVTIYPRKSLTRNIGLDGSGIHAVGLYAWALAEDALWDKTADFEFVREIEIDRAIRSAHFDFFIRPGPRYKARAAGLKFMERIGLHQP
ncbi:MAG: hypothetical protein VX252_01600 [Myxococcota bacterium]|nr:hypothetical protein [Myxococcota bacterium]